MPVTAPDVVRTVHAYEGPTRSLILVGANIRGRDIVAVDISESSDVRADMETLLSDGASAFPGAVTDRKQMQEVQMTFKLVAFRGNIGNSNRRINVVEHNLTPFSRAAFGL